MRKFKFSKIFTAGALMGVCSLSAFCACYIPSSHKLSIESGSNIVKESETISKSEDPYVNNNTGGVTTTLKLNNGNRAFDLKSLQYSPVQIYPSKFNYTFQEGVFGSISSEVWAPNAPVGGVPFYTWIHVTNDGETEIVPADGASSNVAKTLTFKPDASFNNTEIKLRVVYRTAAEGAEGTPLATFESPKMRIWTSPDPQPMGLEFDPYGVRKLFENPKPNSNYNYGIYAQQLTNEDIYRKIFIPMNMSAFYQNLPEDYVKVVSANPKLSPIMENVNPTFNNKNRRCNVQISLRYGMVKGKATTNRSELETIEGNIELTGFKEIRQTTVRPVAYDNMNRADNCTNIVSKFARNDEKWLTLYAQSYILIDNNQINSDLNSVRKITVLRNSVESTVIEFRISNMNVPVVIDGERDIVIQDALVQETIIGYRPDWTPDTISASTKIYDYIPGSPNNGWISSQKLTNYTEQDGKLSTTAKILIGSFIAFGVIVCLGLVYLVYTAKTNKLKDRIYI